MKKFAFSLCLLLLAISARSQGLENIIVEKYYISDANDAVAATGGYLPTGSVTYRIYVDMKPGYKFKEVYGSAGHELRIATSTYFFNNEDRGEIVANSIFKNQLQNNTVMLDSWLSAGAASNSAGSTIANLGILKADDDGVATVVNVDGLLQNANTLAGIPIKTQDGLIAGTPKSIVLNGLGADSLFSDQNFVASGTVFSETSGSWGADGAIGATSDNMVLIAQITTDGVFSFKLNIKIETSGGGIENYVAENPLGSEIQFNGCIYSSSSSGNVIVRTVKVTAPVNSASFITGDLVPITVSAAVYNGPSVFLVEFFANGIKRGDDSSPPYQLNWTPSVAGTYSLTAVVTDNNFGKDTSSVVIITVTNNVAPTVSITSPPNDTVFKEQDPVIFKADAFDTDGTISTVEFFVNNLKVGADNDNSAPYQFNWFAVAGTATITAVATDNRGAKDTSAIVKITVNKNLKPTVSITTPTVSAVFVEQDIITISANAIDSDGTISSVQFFINGVKKSEDGYFPYNYPWTSAAGTYTLTAIATDNLNAKDTSAIVIITVNNNTAPAVSIPTPPDGAVYTTGKIIPVRADASDVDGTISSVELIVVGEKDQKDYIAPYQIEWIPAAEGIYTLYAIATDNKGLQTTSEAITVKIEDFNFAPAVSIVAPVNGALYAEGSVVAIEANASDQDGTITQVEFLVNGVIVGVDIEAPYESDYTANSLGTDTITAVAIDNKGMKKSSTVKTIAVSPVGINDLSSSPELFKVYPNPTKGMLTIAFLNSNYVSSALVTSSKQNTVSYTIYDILGNVILRKEQEHIEETYVESIDISSFANGQYFIVLSADGVTYTKRIIKN